MAGLQLRCKCSCCTLAFWSRNLSCSRRAGGGKIWGKRSRIRGHGHKRWGKSFAMLGEESSVLFDTSAGYYSITRAWHHEIHVPCCSIFHLQILTPDGGLFAVGIQRRKKNSDNSEFGVERVVVDSLEGLRG